MSNRIFVRTERGGTASALVIEQPVFEKVEKLLSWDMREFHRDPSKLVMPMYDHVQSQPIVKTSQTFGYKTPWGAALALFTGWHFLCGYPKKTLYMANSEGLRLIAEHGCPSRAYASLNH
jgi:hypothetical protein